jgi:rSAM/selenodomain-associated transferase 1
VRGERCAILIFARVPELGRVKTRLAAEIGAEAALAVYIRLARHTVREALVLAPRVAIRVHFTPPDAGDAGRWLGPEPTYIPQAEGDLGQRLDRAFRDAFTEGFTRVIVIGSDLPDLTTARLRNALAQLERNEAVIGPSFDGGYYLLGLRRLMPEIFRDITWSTATVFGETVERLRMAGVEPAVLETLRDVDRAEDLPKGWKGNRIVI